VNLSSGSETQNGNKYAYTELKVRQLLSLLEESAMVVSANKAEISITSFDKDLSLEIIFQQRFLKASFEFEQNDFPQSSSSEAIIQLDYTAKDLYPLKGLIVNERTYQGTIEKFYLVKGEWFYLDPFQFAEFTDQANLLVTKEFLEERILKEAFLV
jgi:hypothetical protein